MKKVLLAAAAVAAMTGSAMAGSFVVSNAGAYDVHITYNEVYTNLDGSKGHEFHRVTVNAGQTKRFNNATGPWTAQAGCSGYGQNHVHTDYQNVLHAYGSCTIFSAPQFYFGKQ